LVVYILYCDRCLISTAPGWESPLERCLRRLPVFKWPEGAGSGRTSTFNARTSPGRRDVNVSSTQIRMMDMDLEAASARAVWLGLSFVQFGRRRPSAKTRRKRSRRCNLRHDFLCPSSGSKNPIYARVHDRHSAPTTPYHTPVCLSTHIYIHVLRPKIRLHNAIGIIQL
jgi:hypothetical protein